MMSDDPIARAKEIAARLSNPSNLDGKRKRLGEDDQNIKRVKVYVPVDQFPEVNFLGILIGPRGQTQKELQESSGAKILFRGRNSNKDGSGNLEDSDEDLHVLIEGTEEAVARARQEVEKILFNPQEALKIKSEQLRQLEGSSSSSSSSLPPGHSVLEMTIPNSQVGLVIGKGGENLVRLQAQFGVTLQISKEGDPRPVTIKGPPDALEDTRRRIEEIVAARSTSIGPRGGEREGTGGAHMLSAASKDLNCKYIVNLPMPNERVGVIIGKGGLTIKALQEKTNCQVYIPPTADEDNPSVRTLTIGSNYEHFLEAIQKEIFNLVQASQAGGGLPAVIAGAAVSTITMPVPDDKIGLVIGKGGYNIKDIQARTGTKVNIPQTPDAGSHPPVRTIQITGTAENQTQCRYEIELIISGQSNPMKNASMNASGSYYQPPPSTYSSTPGYDYSYYSGYGSSAAVAAPLAPAAPALDMTIYYNDFWIYAAHYGEDAARLYYDVWSPPKGTPPPEGIVLPSPEEAARKLEKYAASLNDK